MLQSSKILFLRIHNILYIISNARGTKRKITDQPIVESNLEVKRIKTKNNPISKYFRKMAGRLATTAERENSGEWGLLKGQKKLAQLSTFSSAVNIISSDQEQVIVRN